MTQINTIVHQIIKDNLPLSATAHDNLLENNRSLYAALLNLPGLSDFDAIQIITRLLAVTSTKDTKVSLTEKQLEDKLIGEKLPYLKVETVLEGFQQLVNLKVNNQRTSGWIKRYILGSPQLELWAITHRKQLGTLLRHAMGKQVAQTCVHFILRTHPTEHEATYLNQHIYKYIGDNVQQLVEEVFLFVFKALTYFKQDNPFIKLVSRQPSAEHELLTAYFKAREDIQAGSVLPYKTLRGIASIYHPKMDAKQIKRIARKSKVKREVANGETPTDNTLVGQIRNFYLNGEDSKIFQKVIAEANRLPHWNAHVTLILDLSHSMTGTGTRAYNSTAIAMAIREVLSKKTDALTVLNIGSTEDVRYPTPNGATNLANALLKAYENAPDVILVVTDGYENMEQGDAAAILKATKSMGLDIPVLHILPAFTVRENYTHRQPLGDVPVILETGQQGFLPLWLRIQLELNPENVEDVLKASLQPILN